MIPADEALTLADKMDDLASAATEGSWAWESTGEKSNEWCLGLTSPPVEGEIHEEFDEVRGEYKEKPIVDEFVCSNGVHGKFGNAEFISRVRTLGPKLAKAVRDLATISAHVENFARVQERERILAIVRRSVDCHDLEAEIMRDADGER